MKSRLAATVALTACVSAGASLPAQGPPPAPGAGAAPPAAPGPQGPPRGGGRGPAVPSGPGRSVDPFPPLEASAGVITVTLVEFASLPDVGTQAARMNLLVDEPGSRRLFVNLMTGLLYALSYDGKTVTPYLDINDPKWAAPVQAGNTEQGFQSFAFHPDFTQRGRPGFGKFYTWLDTSNTKPAPDFVPGNNARTHDEVLLEWTAKDPRAATYDGAGPRELLRVAHPFPNHNGGQIAFNPLARRGQPEYGLLYVGSADGGAGGDPLNNSQKLDSIFGKILRIDPLGTNAANGKYGIPPSNPFVKTAGALGEIYSYGHRNPGRFSWDPKNGNMFEAEIGQNINEEINQIVAGGNYGWNVWEGSFQYFNREVGIENQRGDPKMIYPVVEYDHTDPILQRLAAATGIYAYRDRAIPQLRDTLIFGDNPSGEVFYLDADELPQGGTAFRRVLFAVGGQNRTLLQVIQAKNEQQGKKPATRVDLRMGMGPDGQLFLLNKRDGVIRLVRR